MDWDYIEKEIKDGAVRPLVHRHLGVTTKAANSTHRMVGYEETGFLDTYFSILETKELVGLAVDPRKSRHLDMVLQVAKVGSIVY